jgi:two-component system response regulator HydG
MGPDLVENALFGYPKECKDKADAQKHGLLASTEGGTVFLDEIDTLPLDLQARLLAALRDKEFRLAESGRAVRISVRILAATSRDLTQMVKEGVFRMDLYRLLSVVNLRIPPLRGRPDDIAFLAKRFLEKIQRQIGSTCILSDETLEMLETYDWPENVQELESTIARACAQSSGSELKPIHLPLKLLRFHKNRKTSPVAASCLSEDLDESASKQSVISIAKVEKKAILEALRDTGGDKTKAATLLGIGKTTLYRRLKEYGFFNEATSSSSLTPVADATDSSSVPFCA